MSTTNFLFIHIPKCAGTSISESLIPHNPAACQGKNGNLWVKSPQPSLNSIVMGRDDGVIPPDNLEGYNYIFSVVRNPWDRAVSWFFWHQQRSYHDHFKWYKEFSSFEEWVMGGMETRPHRDIYFQMKDSWLLYGDSDEHLCDLMMKKRRRGIDALGWTSKGLPKIPFLVDDIFKQEDLTDPNKPHWKHLVQKCGLAYRPLKHTNKSKHKNYKDYYNEKMIEAVYNICKEDIEFFGYSFS